MATAMFFRVSRHQDFSMFSFSQSAFRRKNGQAEKAGENMCGWWFCASLKTMIIVLKFENVTCKRLQRACNRLLRLVLPVLLLFVASLHPAFAGDTLDTVRERGYVRCGVDQTPGFARLDPDGNWQGFDVDFCRAVAAAVLGRADAARFFLMNSVHKFEAIRNSSVDIVLGMTTLTYQRDTGYEADFAGVTFYDAQGFLAWSSLGAKSVSDLANRKRHGNRPPRVCVLKQTTSEDNLKEFLKLGNLEMEVFPLTTIAGRRDAFLNRVCDMLSGDRGDLISTMSVLDGNGGSLVLFDDLISREPLGLVVNSGDQEWFDIVKWVTNLTKAAEAAGIDSGNAGKLTRDNVSPEVARMMGLEGELGLSLGLDHRWGYRVVSQVGNYGEIFERNLGQDSPLGLKRGLNALWRDGGLHYPMPFR